METELCTEIGNQVLIGIYVCADSRVYGLFVIGFKGRHHPLKILHENPVIDCGFQSLLGYTAQKRFGVMAGTAPEVLVESGKQAPDLPVPAVEKVVGEVFQTLQCFGNTWSYFKCKACT